MNKAVREIPAHVEIEALKKLFEESESLRKKREHELEQTILKLRIEKAALLEALRPAK